MFTLKSSGIVPSLLMMLFAVGLLVPATIHAQTAPGRRTMAVLPVKVMPSLEESIKNQGGEKALTLGRTVESLDAQLTDAFQQLRRFTIVARSDVSEVIDDQDFQAIFSQNSSFQPEQFSITGAEYLLVCTIDDYQDVTEELKAADGRVLAQRREVRLSIIAKLWHSQTGELLESANFQLSTDDAAEQQQGVERRGDGNFAELLVQTTREGSARVAQRILDVIYPARILAMTGDVVTLNRGEGTGIEVGQTWKAFALGEALVDPDTGEVLGSEEVELGSVTIISITPTMSRARTVEDYGIGVGNVLRRMESTR